MLSAPDVFGYEARKIAGTIRRVCNERFVTKGMRQCEPEAAMTQWGRQSDYAEFASPRPGNPARVTPRIVQELLAFSGGPASDSEPIDRCAAGTTCWRATHTVALLLLTAAHRQRA